MCDTRPYHPAPPRPLPIKPSRTSSSSSPNSSNQDSKLSPPGPRAAVPLKVPLCGREAPPAMQRSPQPPFRSEEGSEFVWEGGKLRVTKPLPVFPRPIPIRRGVPTHAKPRPRPAPLGSIPGEHFLPQFKTHTPDCPGGQGRDQAPEAAIINTVMVNPCRMAITGFACMFPVARSRYPCLVFFPFWFLVSCFSKKFVFNFSPKTAKCEDADL